MKLRVGMIQMEVAFADPDQNYQLVEERVTEMAQKDPDVIVLPETWNTGFFPEDVKKFVQGQREQAQAFLSKLAATYGTYIIGGSVANCRNQKMVNTCYVYDDKGELVTSYDKVHLFSYLKEDRYFCPGEYAVTFEIKPGLDAGLAICYDLRFPELFRTLALQGAKVFFVPAHWPLSRIDHWNLFLRARAVENQSFVIGVNGVGTTPDGVEWGGHSTAVDPWGVTLKQMDQGPSLGMVDLDLDEVIRIREKMSIFSDRQLDVYDLMHR